MVRGDEANAPLIYAAISAKCSDDGHPAFRRSLQLSRQRRFLSHSKKSGTSSVIPITMASALIPTHVKATASDCMNGWSPSERPAKIPAHPNRKRIVPAMALRRNEARRGNRKNNAIRIAAPTHPQNSFSSIRFSVEHDQLNVRNVAVS